MSLTQGLREMAISGWALLKIILQNVFGEFILAILEDFLRGHHSWKVFLNMSEHHLILGETIDFITGETIKDTHDERYRQKIARFLVEEKGHLKTDIKPRQELRISIDGNIAVIRIDFAVIAEEKTFMIIRYGPGSLVTRERPSLAAARLLEPYQIPITVVTNGKDAEILDTVSGKVIAHGFDAIPSKKEVFEAIKKIKFQALSAKRGEKEARILYAFDVVGSCECGKPNRDTGSCP